MMGPGFLWLLLFIASFSPQLSVGEVTREFEIFEGIPPGTSIGFIGSDLPGSVPPGPPYLIVPVPGSSVDTDLSIDQSTGEIRSRIELDRETRDLYSLVAIPINGENIRVIIKIKDNNDNSPSFPSPFMAVEFPENTPRDVKRTLAPARDHDLGLYNTQRYVIAAGNTNNAFRLSSHRERDGVLYLDLQVNGFLDRETTPFYSLRIEAFDGGIPPLKGSMTVNVTIQDNNDNQPIFNQSRYFATVPENATLGTSVLQVFATDTDSGPNGRISYSINRRQTDKESIFTIDTESGIISLNRPLDYELKEVHELVVVAQDNGLQPLETTVFVSIRVINVNDNQPVISLIFLTDDASPKVLENATPGQFIARISVHDPDTKVEYQGSNVTLDGGEGHFGLATRNGVYYLVVVSRNLDREIKPHYSMSVQATEKGSASPYNTSTHFRIYIQDVNDNAPLFEQAEYRASVLEVSDPGTSVLQVMARDLDLGNNSQITYEIRGSHGSHHVPWFSINPQSGLITTRAHIDCETDPMPRITVVATDNGKPPLSSSTTVVVTIKNINDNEPIFDHSFYNVSISESTPIGKCILKVSASDPDCGVNALVNYTIRESHLRKLPLTVDSVSGEICVSGTLDFEEKPLFEIPVIATDTGGLSSTTVVKISLTDENDNSPIFYPIKYNISLREGVPIKGPIVSVAAIDKDSGRFGQITYKIIRGNENGLFSVNKDSGEIFVSRQLTRSTPLYRIQISAVDGNGRISEKPAQITISVVDSKQKPPLFMHARYSFSIDEDVPINSIVGSISATGGDRVSYSISSGDPYFYFTIDGSTGMIKTARELDYEKHPEILLNIQATSQEPHAYSHCQVQINIADTNDNTPTFESDQVSIWVPESAEIGSTVYAAHAVDGDSGPNGRISYNLYEGGSNSRVFKLDRTEGRIILQEALDFEAFKRYTLVVGARDNGEPPRYAQNLTLFIEVQDVNDFHPVFDQSSYSVSVSESLEINSHITEVHATDEDTGNNARISYSLSEPKLSSIFGVFPNSGIVYLKSKLDRESIDNYQIKIMATDHGSPPLSTTTLVRLRVTDENDHFPYFDEKLFKFSMTENNEVGAIVGRVFARDSDIGENGAIRYTLQPAHSHFQIEPNSGSIIATASLDREKQKLYELQVVAYDQGIPQKQTEVIVHINVEDTNDNSPSIIEPDEDLLIVREEQPEGTEVTRIVATDPDNGRNASLHFSLINDGYSDSEDFSIDSKTGIVRTRSVLDHEKKPFYTLGILVRDDGLPPLETVREFRIECVDLNDNRPVWSRSKFNFKVYENATIGHLVGTVTATDQDSGDNGRITYIIIRGNTHNSFDIDKTTGALLVAKELNYEITSHYMLQIKAVDNSELNPQSNFISIEIAIGDVNDERPIWTQDPIVFSIPENAQIGQPLWNFTALDSDDGLNGVIHYSILEQGESDPPKFRINILTGTLYLQAPLDYEENSSLVIVIGATDQAPNPHERLRASVTAHIILEDINDHTPTFVSPSAIQVYGGEPLKSIVHTLIVTDGDSRDNGRITYTLESGNEPGFFQLDSQTGEISIVKSLDSENFDYFTLNVSACDGGDPVRNCQHQLLQITVEELNNSPPQFAYKKYEATVMENAPVGTEVLKVSAFNHRNISPNNTLSLVYVIPEGSSGGKFQVHPTSGSISVLKPLDRELAESVVFPVLCHDPLFTILYDITEISISLTDYNDNAPDFKDSCIDLYVPENSELGIIHTFTAVDPDFGRNGEVSFSLLSGNLDNMFSLDVQSGRLSSRPLDRERRAYYHLLVSAQDQGSPLQRTTCNITVFVEDENDNGPQFGQSQYSTSIPENVPVGTTVLTVEASDADIGINSRLVYSLNNESHWHFTIDNDTGAIVTAGTLDREKIREYIFEVAATDGGLYDSRSSKTQVHIVLKDVNNHRPTFSENPVLVNVQPPFKRPGQSLVQIVAQDSDEGVNAQVTYSLEPPDHPKFRINPSSGVITPQVALAPERGRAFHLKVVARDGGNPQQLSSTALVVIQVGDIPRSQTLRFQETLYRASILENSSSGTKVIQIEAHRNDGRRQKINFSIVGGNEEGLFEVSKIDLNRASIQVTDKSIDREISSFYTLVISAQSDDSIPIVAHTTVQINITDENDNSPRFTQDSYQASVWEGNNKGTFVTQVTATDNDEGANANLIYHIVDGNLDNAFIIDPAFSGIVKTNIMLDREIQDKYRLTIIATDEGSPQMTGTSVLLINVIDANDNQPTFPPHSTISAPENSPVGSVITTVVANDVDTNPALVYTFTDSGNPDGIFSIGKYSGRVTLAKPMDYEKEKSHTVQIQVSDSVHIAFTSLTVKVQNVNDNSPKFGQNIYHVSIPDDTKPGSQVLQVNASDADHTGLIKYSIRIPNQKSESKMGKSHRGFHRGQSTYNSGSGSSWSGLWIDEKTGIIYTNGSINSDIFKNPYAQLILVATDSGTPAKSAEATLLVEMSPSESELLRFSQNKYSAQIRSDAKPGHVVTILSVEFDKKSNKNQHFHYSIQSTGNSAEFFTISSHTGEILLAKELNTDMQSEVKLTISAQCINMVKCSTTTELTIKIENVSDLHPKFNQSEYRISVSESVPIGSNLLRILATSSNPQNQIKYEITSGNDGQIFEINHKNGAILLRKQLDYDRVTQYRFVVRARNVQNVQQNSGHFEKLWNLAVILIDVEDENDHGPQFPFPLYLEFVGENEPIGTSVFTARATDLDKGVYGKLNYSILEGDGKDKFKIDPVTGIVTTDRVFDYESKARYFFTLRANDIGGQSTTVKVQIDIDSRDEFPPYFTQKIYRLEIPSNARPGYILGRVEALDEDRGPDGRVMYLIRNGQNGLFKVNRTTGAISLKQSLNSEVNSSLVIIANSGRPGSRSAMAVVEISVGGPSDELEMASSSSVSDWVVGLLVTSLLLLFLCCTVFAVLHLRQKKQTKNSGSTGSGVLSGKSIGNNYGNAFDTLEYAPSTMRATSIYSPQYSDLQDYKNVSNPQINGQKVQPVSGGHLRRGNNNTGSELSDQSNSASSGRGSAEDGEEVEDEEIRMINEAKQMAESPSLCPGGDCDDDTLSQNSAKNTQEYLARLGIRPKNLSQQMGEPLQGQNLGQRSIIGKNKGEWIPGDNLDSIHIFNEEGTGLSGCQGGPDDDGLDISTLIYSQIPEDMEPGMKKISSISGSMSGHDSPRQHQNPQNLDKSGGGPGSNNYNWDYLLDWGPQYQPLAHVFSEIARLKDDTSSVGSGEAHYSGIRSQATRSRLSNHSSQSGQSQIALPHKARSLVGTAGHQMSMSNCPRSGPLPPLPNQHIPMMPRSPISHDNSALNSGLMSPSFSPALSPLANRSPTMSPIGSSVIRTCNYNQNYSGSESEMRI